MRSATHIEIDVECGWVDDVGSSLIARAKGVAALQENACGNLMGLINGAEQKINSIPKYKSNNTAIDSCKID